MRSVNLRPVSSIDFRFLFDLLKERDPKANISHKKMPTYSEHVKFVKSKPYSRWYIIEKSKTKIGSIYLSKSNEIGIFLKKKYSGRGYGSEALRVLMEKNPRSRYLANISPRNLNSIRFFKNNGFKLIQHTFELESDFSI
ncbi:MAG: GNAT family N-acetyltransferase [Candidatus Nitrosotenuis sp.]|jgi:RimJ/RimL family protein N-acetyltransferase